MKSAAASAGTSGGPGGLGAGGNLLGGTLTPADRHGSVQVVSSTNGELGGDDPAGHSHTPITAQPEIEMAEETKYVSPPILFYTFLSRAGIKSRNGEDYPIVFYHLVVGVALIDIDDDCRQTG